jgi:hypothetical protein
VSLTAAERETIITMNDEDDTALISTAQRPVITKLKKNPAATLIEEGKFDGSVWARFEMPADLLSFRSTRVKRELSEEEKEGLRERIAHARAAKA